MRAESMDASSEISEPPKYRLTTALGGTHVVDTVLCVLKPRRTVCRKHRQIYISTLLKFASRLLEHEVTGDDNERGRTCTLTT
jgi:hypothetical protein